MSSIPGPIIVFRVGGQDLSGALRPEFDKIKNDAKATSSQIAQEWQVMSAKIRASIATEASGTKEITASRKELIGVLQQQLSLHGDLSNATNKQLASYKAITLELERQKSFLKGTGGVTVPSQNIASQISTQTALGFTRALDSLVDRYLGGFAGALTRTARDVGYYSSLAGGKGGLGAGFSGALSSIGGAVNPGLLGAGIGVASLAATGVAVTAITHQMMEYAQSIQNVSAATGLTYSETQKFRELAKITGLDVDTLTMSFGRIQAELGKFVISGKDSEGATQNFVKVLDRFGVSVTDANGKLRPISGTMSDFFTVLDQIPDEATRTAIAMDAMGVRGKVLVQLFSSLRAEGLTLTEALAQVRKATLDDEKIKQLLKEKKSWDDLVTSIDAGKLHLEAFIATHKSYFFGPGAFIGAGKEAIGRILSYGDFVGAPGEQGALPLGKGAAGTPTRATAYGTLFADEQKLNAELQKRAEIIRAGGKAQFELAAAEKKYAEVEKADADAAALAGTEMVHLHGAEQLALAKKIESLKESIKLHKEEIALALKGSKEFTEMMNRATLHPGRPHEIQGDNVDTLIDRFLKYGTVFRSQVPGPVVPNDNGILTSPGGGAILPNYLPEGVGAGAPPRGAPDLLEQIKKEHDDLFKTQREIDIEHYADELKDLNDALKDQLISHEQYGEALKKLQADRNKTLIDADKKFNDEAGKLFDDLIAGNVKGFAKSLEKDVLESLLAPVKKKFSEEFGNILGNLDRSATSVAGGGVGAPQSGGILGKIFGGIFGGKVGPGGTAGTFPGPIGSGAGGGVGGGAGQFGVATMNVTAATVNLSGSLALPGQGPLGSTTGNFFANLNPFSDNNLPFTPEGSARAATAAGISGGSTSAPSSSDVSSIFSRLGPFLAGGALLGMGLGTKNTSAAIMGAASLTGSALTSISKSLADSQGDSGLSTALGTAGKALPGIGMFAAGIQKGGVGGTLESTLGGAEAGTAIAPGIGTAIGAGVGLISGILSSIISGPSFAQRVQRDMRNQQYTAPPSETFSFAMGNTIADTLSTGFNQSGSHFGTYGLAAGTPFFADPITGRLSKDQQLDLMKEQMGLLSNQPFLGFPTTDPFVGQGPVGKRLGTQSGSQTNNFTIHAMDSEDVNNFFTRHGDHISRLLNSNSPYSSSSGFGSASRRVTTLP